jgi:hypothetical protein
LTATSKRAKRHRHRGQQKKGKSPAPSERAELANKRKLGARMQQAGTSRFATLYTEYLNMHVGFKP